MEAAAKKPLQGGRFAEAAAAAVLAMSKDDLVDNLAQNTPWPSASFLMHRSVRRRRLCRLPAQTPPIVPGSAQFLSLIFASRNWLMVEPGIKLSKNHGAEEQMPDVRA